MSHNLFDDFLTGMGVDPSEDAADAPEDHAGISCHTVHPYVSAMVEEFTDGDLDLDERLTDIQKQFTACLSTQIADLQDWQETELRDQYNQVLGTVPTVQMTYEEFVSTIFIMSRLTLEFQGRWNRMNAIEEPDTSGKLNDLLMSVDDAIDILSRNSSAFEVDSARMALQKARAKFNR